MIENAFDLSYGGSVYLKVLMIANMYPSRGNCSGNFIRDQVKSLEKSGIDVNKVVKKNRNPVYYISFLGLSALKLIFSDYDLVHAHFVPHSALMPALLKRKPLVVQFHGSDARIIPWKNKFNYSLTKFVTLRADKIIAVSEEIKHILVSRFDVPSSKVEVISVGVDTELFHPMDKQKMRVKLGVNIKKDIVLFVGRITEMKGVELIYQCASQTPDVDYIFIGKKIDEKAKDLNNCAFVGEIPHSEIPNWMNAADVLVLPSYSEGLPTVVGEALSCGIPAIVSDVGGCPEVVKDEVTGFVVRTGDAEQLMDRIVHLFSDKQIIRKMGFEGRLDMVERYDHNNLINKLNYVYGSLQK